IREASSGLRRVIRSGKYLPIGSATAPKRDRPLKQYLLPTELTPLISNFLKQSRANFLARKTRPRALLRVSRSPKPDVSFGDSVTRKRRLDRRTIATQFPKRAATGCSRRAGVKQALDPSPCARGGRRSVSFRWPAVCRAE